MLFCPKCGSILQPKTEKGKKLMTCSCGYKDKSGEEVVVKETIQEQKQVEIVDEEESLPLAANTVCPKCEHNEVGYWLVQTRAGDEPETKFLKCMKCKHTWRDYS